MTDEMLRKVIILSALTVTLESNGINVLDLVTKEEADAIVPIIDRADEVADTNTLMKTMLREHLTDILATTKEVA